MVRASTAIQSLAIRMAPRRLLKYSTSLLTHKLAGTRAIFMTDFETLPPGYFLAAKRLRCSCKMPQKKTPKTAGRQD